MGFGFWVSGLGFRVEGCHGIEARTPKVVPKVPLNILLIWPLYIHMGGCQNHGPLLDPDHTTAPNI